MPVFFVLDLIPQCPALIALPWPGTGQCHPHLLGYYGNMLEDDPGTGQDRTPSRRNPDSLLTARILPDPMMPLMDRLQRVVGALLFPVFLWATPSLLAQTSGVKEIKVPYGLSWGDSPEKIREMIRGVKGTELSSSEKLSGRLQIEAEGLGLGESLLKRSVFCFRDGSLTEVELQYGDPTWDAAQTVDFFDRTRRRIDERYGPGILMVNRIREKPDGEKIPQDMSYTLIIYRWSQPAVNLELDYYGVEGGANSLRLVSLHYKSS